MVSVLASILLAHVVLTEAVFDQAPQVVLRQGQYRGETQTFTSPFLTITEHVDVFLGIPYAKPPIGERRFRLPEPLNASEDTYNATEVPPSCPQAVHPISEHLLARAIFSEDCLYLNVFVPQSLQPNATVMVFIHGGGFADGSGSDIPFNSVPLAAIGNVIVVTINYRLNILGFFSTGDDSIPPNIGLTDQRSALRWVNENIAGGDKASLNKDKLCVGFCGPCGVAAAFGGDPKQVTIFGASAGAAAVGWHVLSPGSRRYFQRAILQSGSPLALWAPLLSTQEAFQVATRIAVLAGCELAIPEDTRLIADCLKAKSTEELIDIMRNATVIYPSDTLWASVNDGVFFTSDVRSLLAEGGFKDVDIITGTAKNEGNWFNYFLSGLSREKPFIDRATFALFSVGMDDPLITGLLASIYSDGIDGEDNYVDALSESLGDVLFTCPAQQFAVEAAAAGSKVFVYRFTHEPFRSLWNFSWAESTHYDDLQFVFGLPFQGNSNYPPQYDEIKISLYVMRMWTNFAKSGDPNVPVELPGRITEWPQFTPGSEEYKELDIAFANKRILRQHQCNFWRNILQQLIALKAGVDDVERDNAARAN